MGRWQGGCAGVGALRADAGAPRGRSLDGEQPFDGEQPLDGEQPFDGEQCVDGITLVGLVFEVSAGLRRMLAPALDEQIGVGGQSFEILLRLSRSPGRRLRLVDLASQTGLTPSGLTRALDRLVGAGLVTREACCDDRRGAFAILTPCGRERMEHALARHARDIGTLLGGVLSDEEADRLAELLRKLRDRVHAGATAGATGRAADAGGEVAPGGSAG